MKRNLQSIPERALSWLDTGGGPFVLIQSKAAALWRGLRNVELDSDFDRACDVEDYLDLVPFPGGDALVLADAPFPTAVLAGPTFGGVYLIRRLWGDEDDQATLDAVHDLRADTWNTESLVFDAGDGDCRLFDAVHPGGAAPETLHFQIAPGRHSIQTADVQEEEALCLMVHRLVPLS